MINETVKQSDVVKWRVLHIDDDEDDYILTRSMLALAQGKHITLDWAPTVKIGRELLSSVHYDAVLVDYDLGIETGIELIREFVARGYQPPLILFTGRGSYKVDVEAMRAGATMYLTKGEVTPLLLERSIRYAIERKQAEDRVRESEERFRSVLENSLDMAYRRNLLTDRYDYMSPVVEQVVGFTIEEMDTMSIDEVLERIHPDDRQAVADGLKRASETGKARLQYRFLHKNGQYRWMADNVTVQYGEDGTPLYRGGIMRDITEHEQTEQSLRESEERFRRALENIPDVVVLYDRDLRIQYINSATLKVSGRPVSYFLGRRDDEVWPPDVYENYLPTLKEALATRQIRSIETELRLPTGEARELVITCVPITGEDGEVREVVGITHDITEYERAERALRRSEERFNKAFETSPNAQVISRQEDGMIQVVNEGFARMFGHSREEVIGKTSIELGMYANADDRKKAILQLQKDGIVRDYEIDIRTKSGEVRHASLSVVMIHTGRENLMLTIIQDIHERKTAERAVRESEERLRLALAGSEYGTWDWDLKTDALHWDERCKAIFDVQDDRSITLESIMENHIDPRDRQQVTNNLAAVLQGGQEYVEEYRVQRRNGEVGWVFVRGRVYQDANGQPYRMSGTVQDITSRKQVEESLRNYARQLERSNQALEDFAFIASHDLQEPLRKVQGFGRLLESRFAEQLGAEGREYIERMKDSAGRMSAMINGMLEYSRASTRDQSFLPVDLNQAAGEALSDLDGRISQAGGRVEVGELPTIQADPLQMRQLFSNLISNALKYSRPGVPPVVTLSASRSEDDWVDLTIADNGLGFDMQNAGYIFQPFHRLDGRAGNEGMGMGLAICRKIVERHGGRISVTSTPGEGSTFTVSLPVSSEG